MFSWYDSIRKTRITLYRFVFTRFLRIFTVSVMVILLTFLMPLVSNGPYYQDLMRTCASNCVRNFWKNLLFINNRDSFTEIVSSPLEEERTSEFVRICQFERRLTNLSNQLIQPTYPSNLSNQIT